MKIITALLLGLTLLTCTGPAYAQTSVPRNCLANEAVAAKNLLDHHGEVLTHMAIAAISGRYRGGEHAGSHVMQIYINPETRAWTAVIVHPANEGGFACPAGSGTAWLDITTILGDPA